MRHDMAVKLQRISDIVNTVVIVLGVLFVVDDARIFCDRDHLSINIWQCTYLVILSDTSIFALARHAECDGGIQVRRTCGNIHGD